MVEFGLNEFNPIMIYTSKDGFFVTLQMNIEDINCFVATLFSLADQRLASYFPFNQIQHGIVLVGILLIGKIHPCIQAYIDTSRHDP